MQNVLTLLRAIDEPCVSPTRVSPEASNNDDGDDDNATINKRAMLLCSALCAYEDSQAPSEREAQAAAKEKVLRENLARVEGEHAALLQRATVLMAMIHSPQITPVTTEDAEFLLLATDDEFKKADLDVGTVASSYTG